MLNTGFAIALAWPQGYCRRANAWYDRIVSFIGISKNNYYKAGHAAVILIDKSNNSSHYFDFGRYHAPYGHGRVRNAITDYELELETIPKISEKQIINYEEFLYEIQNKEVFHGDGDLFASYSLINFEKAYAKANELQERSPIVYGPFVHKGTNCSRFVQSVILSGLNEFWKKFKMTIFLPLTPTPISNVKALKYRNRTKKVDTNYTIPPFPKNITKKMLVTTQKAPKRHKLIPEKAQWLAGEGYGSWFVLEQKDIFIKMKRYSPKGKLECEGLFQFKTNSELKLGENFAVTYSSNCKKITIIKDNILFELVRI